LKRTSRRLVYRLAAGALALLAAGALLACGDSEDADEPQKLSYEINAKGEATTLKAPKNAEAGLAEITFTNKTKDEADLQLIRVEGEHSGKDVVEGLNSAVRGQKLPDWFFAAGGVGLTEPGETVTVSQVMRPGTYYAFDTERAIFSTADAKTVVGGEVSDDELPAAKGTVKAGEYVFESDAPLPAGTNKIVFENSGTQPHHMLAAKLIGDGTAEEVEKAFGSKNGKPPLDEKGGPSTAVIEGGEAQLVELELEPGRYAFFCFVSDRKGGQPHALMGMVDEIEVK
jgi:Copper binding proteins, plastocyanin/azurin family